MSNELQVELAKIRLHKTSGLAHQKAPALLLLAVEATLKEQNAEATSTAYFAALVTTLDGVIHIEGGLAVGDGDNLPAVLYLVSLVAPHVPHTVIRSQLSTLITLLLPLFSKLHEHAPPLRSLLGTFMSLVQALDASHLATQGVRNGFASMLALVVDSRPKVRKRAAEAIRDILQAAPTPLRMHPYADQVSAWVNVSIGKTVSGPLKARDANAAQAPEGADVAIHLLAFVKQIWAYLPTPVRAFHFSGSDVLIALKALSSLATALLTLPRLGNQYLTQSAYHLLAEVMSEAASSVETPAPVILKSILTSQPVVTDVTLAPSWVMLVGKVMCAYSQSSPGDCAKELGAVWATCWGFLESPVLAVRKAAEEALLALTTCISPAATDAALVKGSKSTLGKMIALLTNSLDSLSYAKATPQILAVLSGLLVTLSCRPEDVPGVSQTPAELLLLPLVQHVGVLRNQVKFVHKESADAVIDEAMRVMGPEVLLRVMPLNLEPDNGGEIKEPRAYLLALLPHLHPSRLSHFVDFFVPLSERMFDLQQKATGDGKAVEAKMWSVLVGQVWAGFAGYCWNPIGLRDAFTPVFAKLLTSLLHSQPALRPSVLNALRIIADTNLRVASGTFEPASHTRLTFALSQTEAQANISFLRLQAGQWLATLFNVFGSVEKEAKGMVGNVIGAWAALAGEQEIAKAYQRVLTLLKQNAVAPYVRGTPDSGVVVLQATEDLLLLLEPYLSAKDSDSLFSACLSLDILSHRDGGVQKRGYRLLARLIDAGKATVAAESVLLQLKAKADAVALAAKRDRFLLLAQLLLHLPAGSLHMMPVLIPEAVLGTKEPSEKSRSAAFELLVRMGRKMSDGGVVRRDKVEDMDFDDSSPSEVRGSIEEYITMVAAGLAGATPHMISASVTAMSRLVFEFKESISQSMLADILTTIMVFLSSTNREIVKSALGFVKLAVHTLSHELISTQLPHLVPALLAWSHDHKNHFKAKVRHIFERILRRFGWDDVYVHAEQEEARKVLLNIKKRKERAKRKKGAAAQIGGGGSDEARNLIVARGAAHRLQDAPVERITGDAFEDVLYGSESELDDSDGEGGNQQSTSATKVKPTKAKDSKQGNYRLRDDPDDPMDLLHGAASKLTLVDNRRQRAPGKEAKRFNVDEDGRILVDDAADAVDGDTFAGGAFRENQTSMDGFTRNARGHVKFNKDTKKRRRDNTNAGSDGDEADAAAARKCPKRRTSEKLGREFKAKNAGGDVRRGALEPYAYLSLDDVAKKTKGRGRVNITGRR